MRWAREGRDDYLFWVCWFAWIGMWSRPWCCCSGKGGVGKIKRQVEKCKDDSAREGRCRRAFNSHFWLFIDLWDGEEELNCVSQQSCIFLIGIPIRPLPVSLLVWREGLIMSKAERGPRGGLGI